MGISVLIITRGRAPHLRSVLGSIRSQKLLPEQVVVVTEDRIDEINDLLFRVLGDCVPRLEVVQGNGQGAANAWNLGTKYCDCEFIAIIDDDDLWLPSHLSVCEAATRYVGADLVLTGFYNLSDTEFKEDMLPPNILETTDFMMFNPGMRGSNIFVRRKCLLECKGFDESLATSSDRGLGIRLSKLQGIQYAPLLKRTVVYRTHSGSRMVDPSPKRLESFNRLLKRFSEDLSREQMAYTLGRINQYWEYPIESLEANKDEKKLVGGWRQFLIGESKPEEYPLAFSNLLEEKPTQMRAFLENEYHRRMRLYDVNYPNSISFSKPPNFLNLIAPTLEDVSHPIARNWIRKLQPGHIVDFGCGNGEVLIPLISEGFKIILYDPDEKHQANHIELETSINHELLRGGIVTIGHSNSVSNTLGNSNYSIAGVVCSMVICQLKNDEELSNLLTELYSVLPVGGRALISWCSPCLVNVEQTHVHKVDQKNDWNEKYYEKVCTETGQHRPEFVWDVEQICSLVPEGFELTDEWFTWGWDVTKECATPWIQFCELRRVE